MRGKWIILSGLLLFIILLSACSSPFMSGANQETTITAEEIPSEPTKGEIESAILGTSANEIDDIIEGNFPLVDTVSGDSRTAEIFATTVFEHDELAELLRSAIEPDETSEVIDDQQIFIYPEHFVTLKPSQDDQNVMLMEVADETFVKRNYAPSFLSTYFTIRMLDSLLGNNWTNNRTQACLTGNCYGGYTGSGTNGSSSRGSIFRGGGPGSGK